MKNRRLIITWKPDVLHMEEHDGSFETIENLKGFPKRNYNWDKGYTARSERDSFNNIKTLEAAEKILSRRNKNEIMFAEWNDQVFFARTKGEAA